MPAFLIFALLLIGAGFIVWNIFYSPVGTPLATKIEAADEANVQVRLGEQGSFIEQVSVDELLENESIRVNSGTATLTFFDDTVVTLDRNTELMIEGARQRADDESVDIRLFVPEGRIWIDSPKMINPRSALVAHNSNLTMTMAGGELSFDQNQIAVIEGRATINTTEGEYEQEVELGQEVMFSDGVFAAIANGEAGPEKQLISEAFRDSTWFKRNTIDIPPGTIVADIEDGEQENGVGTEVEDDDLLIEQEPAADPESQVVIEEPGNNGDTVTVTRDEVNISGTVPSGTQRVIVRNYTLQQFTPGDTQFLYRASTALGTMQQGSNSYEVVAIGANGERTTASITLVYDPNATIDVEDEAEDEELVEDIDEPEETPEEEVPSETEGVIEIEDEEGATAEAVGELTISYPAEGASADEETIEVTGAAPGNAARIVVDGYTLTLFTPGDATWTYRLADRFNNRPLGEKTIIVRAFDEDGALLGEESVTFNIEAAVVTSPAAGSSGTNSSDEITLPPGHDQSQGSTL
jgi:hypothetical protein